MPLIYKISQGGQKITIQKVRTRESLGELEKQVKHI
jgi:hypothetical protein